MDNLKDVINSDVGGIKSSSNIKSEAINVENATESIKHHNRKNVFICSIIIVLIIAILLSTIISALSGKNIYEAFFHKKQYEANSLMDYNNQKILIDDYTILLRQTLWDKKTGIGYLVFEITKKDSKPEIKLNKFGQCIGLGFGENDRFSIENTSSGNRKYEYIGNSLYAYISYTVDISKQDDCKIYIFDRKNGDYEDCAKKYSFELKETTNVKEYNYSNNKIIISPLGMAIENNEKHDSSNSLSEPKIKIVFYLKDGRKKEVFNTTTGLETEGLGEIHRYTKDKGYYNMYQVVFKEIFDIEKIDKIEFNGVVIS